MASHTITVTPRKKTNDVVVPRRSVVQTNVTKGTVLLQNPLPKYTFDLKPKKSSNKLKTSEDGDSERKGKIVEKQEISITEKQKGTPEKVNGVTDSKNESKHTQHPQQKLTVEITDQNMPNRSENGQILNIPNGKPVNKVGPITTSSTPLLKLSQLGNQSVSGSLTSTGTVCVTDILPTIAVQSLNSEPVIQNTIKTLNSPPTSSSVDLENVDNQSESNSVVTSGSDIQLCGAQHNVCDCQEKLKQLEEEKQLLRNQLDVQLKVNQELKKLLVASVGEDLQHRVELLTRDKALLSLEIGDYSKKMVEDYETLDKISIQADMWRSKYLACRVMSDELASSRAFYAMQFQECQMALQQLLSERHELRIHLYESYRGLQLIQGAFDPLNSQSSIAHNLTSKNILSLARTNQHLVDSIKYRLLPSHVTSSMNKQIEVDWNDYLTPAEAHARQLMTREMRPEDFRNLAKPLPPGAMSVDRYHPFQNFDNITFNVCRQCKGDINVV